MNRRLYRALAAAFAALALPVAYAQDAPETQARSQASIAAAPAAEANASTTASPSEGQVGLDTPVPQPPANLIEQPIASAYRTDDAASAEAVKPIVDALNADESLKASKIVVVPDKDVVTLVGVTVSHAQRQRAAQIASQHAGEGKVVNALTSQQYVPRATGVS
jgi:osmotically-inducible protein OsmY